MTSSNNNNCDNNNNNNITHGDDNVVLVESGTLECREPEQQQQQGRDGDECKRSNEDGEVLIDANNSLKKEECTTTGILNGSAAPIIQNPAAVNMVMRRVLLLTTQ